MQLLQSHTLCQAPSLGCETWSRPGIHLSHLMTRATAAAAADFAGAAAEGSSGLRNGLLICEIDDCTNASPADPAWQEHDAGKKGRSGELEKDHAPGSLNIPRIALHISKALAITASPAKSCKQMMSAVCFLPYDCHVLTSSAVWGHKRSHLFSGLLLVRSNTSSAPSNPGSLALFLLEGGPSAGCAWLPSR